MARQPFDNMNMSELKLDPMQEQELGDRIDEFKAKVRKLAHDSGIDGLIMHYKASYSGKDFVASYVRNMKRGEVVVSLQMTLIEMIKELEQEGPARADELRLHLIDLLINE